MIFSSFLTLVVAETWPPCVGRHVYTQNILGKSIRTLRAFFSKFGLNFVFKQCSGGGFCCQPSGWQ